MRTTAIRFERKQSEGKIDLRGGLPLTDNSGKRWQALGSEK